MTIEDIISTVEINLKPININPIQELILRQVWDGKTYAQIAQKTGDNADYIKSMGSQLWQEFSKVLGEPINKRNFYCAITRRVSQLQGKISITIEEILATLKTILKPIDLNPIQELILRQVWEGKTYAQIAEKTGYNADYIKAVGSQLWQCLSKVLGEPITKQNFSFAIKRRVLKLQKTITLPQDGNLQNNHFN
ncbi:MAG: hypothetical protein WBG73_24840 [Coleofasciculaceae cyanobacterium]